jgi:UDP-2,3-diacylglucosamine pyrophosphatase LpxH
MIAVISDLHFEEEASDAIRVEGPEVVFRRNLDAKAYRSFISHMADEARRRNSKDFELIIAGDLFDFSRTTLWFTDELRPYVALKEFSPELEAKVLRILEAIAAEPAIAETLAILRSLAAARYTVAAHDKRAGEERDFPVPVKVSLLAGNHDRIANGTPAIRRRVRELVGLSGDGEFPHYRLLDTPPTLVRHGHEYDRNNFALDPDKEYKTIPLEVANDGYDEANFGDFITIDVATRLPFLFRRKYGDEQIARDQVLCSLYLRLLQFDDVRPQSALLDYMLDDSHGDFSAEQGWERLVPVIQHLLGEIHDNKFFRYWLGKRAKPWAPAELDIARGLLDVGGWKNRPAREAARKISHFMMGGETDEPRLFAMREEVIVENKVRLVVAGHTHEPEVSLIKTDKSGDRFYINTGTWRSVIPSTPDDRSFGRMRGLTYVMLFTPEEQGENCNSFDYWTGYTKDWEEAHTKRTRR